MKVIGYVRDGAPDEQQMAVVRTSTGPVRVTILGVHLSRRKFIKAVQAAKYNETHYTSAAPGRCWGQSFIKE